MMTSITEQRKLSNKSKYFLVALIWLALWELLSLIINEEILFVSPLKVFLKLVSMFGTFEYWEILLFSIIRVLCGFVIGYFLSVIIAVFAFRFSFFEMLISPAISVIKATPVASFIILALMWVGKNYVPVFICILMVTPIVFNNILQGLRNVDKNLLEMADVYNLSVKSRIKNIYIPSVRPYNLAAVGAGLGLCWKAGIAAEVVCRTMPSIGNRIWETKFYLITDEMFAWTATVVILSVIFDILIKKFLDSKTEVTK